MLTIPIVPNLDYASLLAVVAVVPAGPGRLPGLGPANVLRSRAA
ncbi:MAG: hypothetical protein WCF04_00280 [Candidatus Nanopelagicales bacterium]